MAGKRQRLTKEEKEKLMALLAEEEDESVDEAVQETESEATVGTNQVIVFTGTPDDFIRHFRPASTSDQNVAEKSDEKESEDDADETGDEPADEPQPKSRSRYFKK
ncbi:hypothetical protein [Saccharopolyspora hattusasensis]|uniref:hypothetical protein n=1 Tax=Saccharopolyspora hattusasensis TaxID=1128679 RepID=UPI003D991D42